MLNRAPGALYCQIMGAFFLKCYRGTALKRVLSRAQMTDRGPCSKLDYTVVESKRVLRRRPRSLPAAPRARSKWPRRPGLPLGVLETLPVPMPPLFASSAPSVSAFAISAPDGVRCPAVTVVAPPALRPFNDALLGLAAYRVLSCWPAATRAVGTSQTSGQQPMCPWHAAGRPLPRAIVPTFVVL